MADAQRSIQFQYEQYEKALSHQQRSLREEAYEFVKESDTDRTRKFEDAANEYRYEANLAMQHLLERTGTEFAQQNSEFQQLQRANELSRRQVIQESRSMQGSFRKMNIDVMFCHENDERAESSKRTPAGQEL